MIVQKQMVNMDIPRSQYVNWNESTAEYFCLSFSLSFGLIFFVGDDVKGKKERIRTEKGVDYHGKISSKTI